MSPIGYITLAKQQSVCFSWRPHQLSCSKDRYKRTFLYSNSTSQWLSSEQGDWSFNLKSWCNETWLGRHLFYWIFCLVYINVLPDSQSHLVLERVEAELRYQCSLLVCLLWSMIYLSSIYLFLLAQCSLFQWWTEKSGCLSKGDLWSYI